MYNAVYIDCCKNSDNQSPELGMERSEFIVSVLKEGLYNGIS